MVHESDGPRGWPALGNDHSPATTGGPHDRIVVRHQASRAGCGNGKGQLGDAPMTGSVLQSACKPNRRRHITDCPGHQARSPSR
ncbi:hypothetical protein MUK42_08619 [Musa troglodytarum]|nr:hypothetical protein MUK42_08619 [Musa troglodytarum]